MAFYQYPVPLSGTSIENIVSKYAGHPDKLNELVLSNAKDFHNELIESHLEMVHLPLRDIEIRIQTCHNLGSYKSKSVDKLVLMIHGLGGNLTHYEPLISKYVHDHTPFLAFDLPGFGDSDELDQYNMGDVISLICELVHKMCQCKTISIIGHSMGALLSVQVANTISVKCHGLILIGTPPLQNKALKNPFVRLLLKLLWYHPGIFDFYRVRFDQSKGLKSSGIVKFYYRAGNTYGKLYQYYRNIQIKSKSLVGYFLGWQEVSNVPNATPIHLIHGDKDTICAVEKLAQWRTLEGVTVTVDVITDCSHNCLLDATEETLELIMKYT
ncbi:triacylglycerol lipase [Kluyveromyces lactis]|uniref:KLLA0E23035p n=1 Tax=Kluyveromyces lactis (strain ATCC 8585 / CBS 2359 / DSM 70799 / NBRC 1267 / NRRL Y-1140 / WM37) TaxID=284590 RepID=Q6CM48_KLULA|nr:uncharacterized protein KLLA0_E23035g [Kluyveromyces lactis]CAH00078.1 KLLA0E23035p [Kluyveromyces lactis]|eukprot:XP_454991.1 uncharacterized protein KLLA0_E23035g [Kluyveromyces lactis]